MINSALRQPICSLFSISKALTHKSHFSILIVRCIESFEILKPLIGGFVKS